MDGRRSIRGHHDLVASDPAHAVRICTGAHGSAVLSGFVARGAARLPATGAWRAVLTARDGRGEPLTGELALSVSTDGPNLLYLGFLGFLSGGSVLYGWTRRRRAASRD